MTDLPRYYITKYFTGGILKGLTYKEVTTALFTPGQRVDKPVGGSPYVVLEVTPLP